MTLSITTIIIVLIIIILTMLILTMLIPILFNFSLVNNQCGYYTNFASSAIATSSTFGSAFGGYGSAFGSPYGNGKRYNPDNDESDGEGSGNFTNLYVPDTLRPRPDFRYLEDVMKNKCGSNCIVNVNPDAPYFRSFGGDKLKYNTSKDDVNYKHIQLSDGILTIPNSNLKI